MAVGKMAIQKQEEIVEDGENTTGKWEWNSAVVRSGLRWEPPMDFDDDIPFIGHGYGVCRKAIYAIS